MGNFTWPIALSLVGLLIPLVVALLQQLGERSTLRQLERLVEVEKKSLANETRPTAVTHRIRGLEVKLVKELERRLARSAIRRKVTQALMYVLFVASGLIASYLALAGALAATDQKLREIGTSVSIGLIVLNFVGLFIAIFYLVGALNALVPERGPNIKPVTWARMGLALLRRLQQKVRPKKAANG